ncbi:MAG: hypothetical protein ACK5PS_18755 [Desulfopila sp.]
MQEKLKRVVAAFKPVPNPSVSVFMVRLTLSVLRQWPWPAERPPVESGAGGDGCNPWANHFVLVDIPALSNILTAEYTT